MLDEVSNHSLTISSFYPLKKASTFFQYTQTFLPFASALKLWFNKSNLLRSKNKIHSATYIVFLTYTYVNFWLCRANPRAKKLIQITFGDYPNVILRMKLLKHRFALLVSSLQIGNSQSLTANFSIGGNTLGMARISQNGFSITFQFYCDW
jgi:hypothetical protein